MLLNTILGGFATLSAVVTLWSLAVAFRGNTQTQIREIAYRVFRVAWLTFVVSTTTAIIQLYASDVL